MGNKRNYGLPYMGSKSKIVNFICDNIPSCDTFVDLFCGGGSVTHYMVENNRYNHYICNDKNDLVVDLLKNVLEGKYSNEREFITREEFLKRKDTDGYVRYVWSFGNRGTSYLYSTTKEHFKYLLHNVIFGNEFDELRRCFGIDLSDMSNIKCIKERVRTMRQIIRNSYTQYDDIARLQHIENINRLNEVKFDDKLIEFSSLSYQDVVIPDNSVIYCDIPYKGTGTYTSDKFDYEVFYEYALKSEHPIFISEYEMPSDFICVDEIDKKCQFKNSAGVIDTTERLYTTPKSLQIINDNQEIFSWNFKNDL